MARDQVEDLKLTLRGTGHQSGLSRTAHRRSQLHRQRSSHGSTVMLCRGKEALLRLSLTYRVAPFVALGLARELTHLGVVS